MKTPWSKPTVPASEVERMLERALERSWVPGDRALACLDCNAIFVASSSCPACGSRAAYNLAAVLRRAS